MMKNVRCQRRLALLAGLFLSMAAVPFSALSLPGPGPGSSDMCDFFDGGSGGSGSGAHQRPCYFPGQPQRMYDPVSHDYVLVESYYMDCNGCSFVCGAAGDEGLCVE